jgi:hypothetical protein
LKGNAFVEAAFVPEVFGTPALVAGGKMIWGMFCGDSGVMAVGGGAKSSGCFIFSSSNLIPASEPSEP